MNLSVKGTPAQEAAALRAAVAQVLARLNELAEVSGPMAAGTMAGQISLLEDPALVSLANAAIAGGASASAAWRDAVDLRSATFRDSDSAYYRAATTDLLDLCDRVLLAIGDPEGHGPELEDDPAAAILVAEDISPSRFLEIDWSFYRGAVVIRGGAGSHVAMLARGHGIPMLVGLECDLSVFVAGVEAILDAEAGRLILSPAPATVAGYGDCPPRPRTVLDFTATDSADGPVITADGVPVQVCLNVDDIAILEHVGAAGCDGIGLTRTEFLFAGSGGMADEAAQLRAYVRLLDWAEGKPVTVRTLDGGGDKPIDNLSPKGEANPFLGVRGIRLSFARPDVFRVQLRALARAAAHGPLRVMLPMVTVAAEVERARDLFEQVVRELEREGVAARMPPLGMMVEVPAAAVAIATFDADFYAIGSNDLVQFTMAASRDNAAVASLYDPLNPAVIALIAGVVAQGEATGRPVSLCGDMAAMPAGLAAVLATGLRAVSVPPQALAATRAAIAKATLGDSGSAIAAGVNRPTCAADWNTP